MIFRGAIIIFLEHLAWPKVQIAFSCICRPFQLGSGQELFQGLALKEFALVYDVEHGIIVSGDVVDDEVVVVAVHQRDDSGGGEVHVHGALRVQKLLKGQDSAAVVKKEWRVGAGDDPLNSSGELGPVFLLDRLDLFPPTVL